MKKENSHNTIEQFSKFGIAIGTVVFASLFSFTMETKRAVIADQGYRCADCGKRRVLECHHIVPRKRGGSDLSGNCVALCPKDHIKWDKLAD